MDIYDVPHYIEHHIWSLQSLGSLEETYAPMLIPTILKKLPAEVGRNLARAHGIEKWTLTEWRICILQELRILGVPTAPHLPTAAFTASVDHKVTLKQPPTKKSCIFCKSPSHASSRCEVITDTQKRIEVVKKRNLCFNCLGHHKVSQCQSKYQCKFCKRKHHSSLCDANSNSQSQPDKDDTSITTAGTTTTSASTASTGPKTQMLILVSFSSHNLTSLSTTKCLLKTAVADV